MGLPVASCFVTRYSNSAVPCGSCACTTQQAVAPKGYLACAIAVLTKATPISQHAQHSRFAACCIYSEQLFDHFLQGADW